MTTVVRGDRPAVHGRLGALVGLASGIAILNVVLLPGYSWLYDMVIVDSTPFSDRTLGIDGSVPRAVPNDAVVAVLETILPGDLVQALLLMTVFVVVGAGCARLTRSRAGAAAAAVGACWNPYVVERLVIGHWTFLLGYCCLPWIHATAGRAARGGPRDWAPLLGWLTLASLAGSTSAVIAAITAAVSITMARGATGRGRVRIGGLSLTTLAVLNAAWIVPSFARPGALAVDPAGVAAFAARADTPLGVLPSLLTLGGIWHEPSWPGSRGSAVVVGVALATLVTVLVICVRRGLTRELLPLGVAGMIGLVVAGAAALPGGAAAVEWVVTALPGGGIIRDSQKFVALFAVFVAVAAGRAVDQVAPRADHPRGSSRTQRWIVVAALALAPVITLPDAPATAGPTMGSVAIPSELDDARTFLASAAPGGVAVFPWTQYRRFGWNDDRVSLDPWNRLLDRRVVVNDDLPLAAQEVEGEDPVAEDIARAVDDESADLAAVLSRHGIRWALVLTDQPGAAQVGGRIATAPESVRTFGDIRVIDLGEPAGSQPPTGSVIAIAASAAAALAVLVWWIAASSATRRRTRQDTDRC